MKSYNNSIVGSQQKPSGGAGFTPTKTSNNGGGFAQARQFNMENLMASPRDNMNYQDLELIRKRSHEAHTSVALNNAMTNHDLEYFEQMINR